MNDLFDKKRSAQDATTNAPDPRVVAVRGAREHTQKRRSRHSSRRTGRHHRPERIRNPRSPSTRSTREGQRRYVESLSAYALEFLESTERSRTRFRSRACRRRSRSSRKRPRATRARRSAPSPRSTTTCGSSGRGSGCRIRRRPGCRSCRRPCRRWSTGCWRCRRARGRPARPDRARTQGEYKKAELADLQKAGFERRARSTVRCRKSRRSLPSTKTGATTRYRGRRRPPRRQPGAWQSPLPDLPETALGPRRRAGDRGKRALDSGRGETASNLLRRHQFA